MKSKLFAYITVFIISTFVLFNTFYLSKEIENIYDAVNNFDTKSENALDRALSLKETFEKSEIYISLTVSHDDLTNIEEGLAELAGAIYVREYEEAEIIKSRLKNSLEHLRRLSGFNIDGII